MNPETFNHLCANALTRAETVAATYTLARALIREGVPGDFVECGVYAGSHPAAMAHAIIDGKADVRRVHLFDSFAGIPAAGEHDKDWLKAGNPVGMSACPLDTVKMNMHLWGVPDELLIYHAGWFSETVPRDAPGIPSIALLRLDADLYESTAVCLKHLYPKLSRGAWVICDDWTLDGCREAVAPYILKNESCPVYWRAL